MSVGRWVGHGATVGLLKGWGKYPAFGWETAAVEAVEEEVGGELDKVPRQPRQ